MKKTNIDKGFIEIVNYLDDKGFKPWASCDGVLANHKNKKDVNRAYLSFMNSEKIIELMTAFYRDREFEINISNSFNAKSRNYCGNTIKGNTYTVYFSNLYGEKLNYFFRIIKGICEEKIIISDEEKEGLKQTGDIIKDTEGEELYFSVHLNSSYQPYMARHGKVNVLNVTTKEGLELQRNMKNLGDMISQKFGKTTMIYIQYQIHKTFKRVVLLFLINILVRYILKVMILNRF